VPPLSGSVPSPNLVLKNYVGKRKEGTLTWHLSHSFLVAPRAFADLLTEGVYFSAGSQIPCQQQGEEGPLTCQQQ